MTSSTLPNEVLQRIFQQFNKDYDKTRKYVVEERKNLLACVLVNKQWCEIAIPLLWRRTFFQLRIRHSQTLPIPKLIDTYFHYTTDTERGLLLLNNLQVIDRPQSHPRFNYPSFLRQLDFSLMLHAVQEWCFQRMIPIDGVYRQDVSERMYGNAGLTIPTYYSQERLAIYLIGDDDETTQYMKKRSAELLPGVTRILLRILMRNSASIRELHCCGERLETDENYGIMIEPEFAEFLAPVRRLIVSCPFYLDRVYLLLAMLCKNLEYMDISTYHRRKVARPMMSPSNYYLAQDEAKNMAVLIGIQSQLKYLKIRYSEICNTVNYLFPAIKTQAGTLIRLELYKVKDKIYRYHSHAFNSAQENILRALEFWDSKRDMMPLSESVPWLGIPFPCLEHVSFLQDKFNGRPQEFAIWARPSQSNNNANSNANREGNDVMGEEVAE